jgi:cell division transport system ATP-binding protein
MPPCLNNLKLDKLGTWNLAMMITFDSVTKTFRNGTMALENITFEIEEGSFVVIVGRSGSGKTTLQKLLIKELEPESGKIMVDGDDLSKISTKNTPLLRRKVSVVFQDFKVLFDKTVAENILLVLEIAGISASSAQKRLDELLELTGLTGKAEVFPVQLSGGELQRVAIARALATDPKIIFADEPTGNLDDQTAAQIIDLLIEINSRQTTVLVATHDKTLIKHKGAQILELSEGKLQTKKD